MGRTKRGRSVTPPKKQHATNARRKTDQKKRRLGQHNVPALTLNRVGPDFANPEPSSSSDDVQIMTPATPTPGSNRPRKQFTPMQGRGARQGLRKPRRVTIAAEDDGKTREDDTVKTAPNQPPPVPAGPPPVPPPVPAASVSTTATRADSATQPEPIEEDDDDDDDVIAAATATAAAANTTKWAQPPLTWMDGDGKTSVVDASGHLVAPVFSGRRKPTLITGDASGKMYVWDLTRSNFMNEGMVATMNEEFNLLTSKTISTYESERAHIMYVDEAVQAALLGVSVEEFRKQVAQEVTKVDDQPPKDLVNELSNLRVKPLIPFLEMAVFFRKSILVKPPSYVSRVYPFSRRKWLMDLVASVEALFGEKNYGTLFLRKGSQVGHEDDSKLYKSRTQPTNFLMENASDTDRVVVLSGGTYLQEMSLWLRAPGGSLFRKKVPSDLLVAVEGVQKTRFKYGTEAIECDHDRRVWDFWTLVFGFKKPEPRNWGRRITRSTNRWS